MAVNSVQHSFLCNNDLCSMCLENKKAIFLCLHSYFHMGFYQLSHLWSSIWNLIFVIIQKTTSEINRMIESLSMVIGSYRKMALSPRQNTCTRTVWLDWNWNRIIKVLIYLFKKRWHMAPGHVTHYVVYLCYCCQTFPAISDDWRGCQS